VTEATPLLQVDVLPEPIIVDESLPIVDEATKAVEIEATPLLQVDVLPEPIIVDESLPIVEEAT
jgi:hypothetical protein